jgi:hypothetical protein
MADLKPTKLTMGDLTQTGVNKWAAWTGGKPKKDWSGFETATADYQTPNQMRPIYDVKRYNHRKTGLSDKFNKTDTLIPFKKQAWTHLKDNGLDKVTYLPDIWKEMSCVIYDHSHYTLDSAQMASLVQVALYDKYVQVQTIERIEAIKKQIQDHRPQEYPGQDLEKLAVDFCAGALELHNAGQYKHNLTL